MGSFIQVVHLVGLLLLSGVVWSSSQSFWDNYQITWGSNNLIVQNQGSQVQISLDSSSGSGFGSKVSYGSGLITVRMKLSPQSYTAGVVTTFYMSSNTYNHDELDWEFLGHTAGQPYTLQTNVFTNGVGGREQRFTLWFDPSAAFHTYQILLNDYQTVFLVDGIPVRVFKNNAKIGVPYITQPLQILASIWDGDSWATDGGLAKINYAYAPFTAQFQNFGISGCQASNGNIQNCYSSQYWWNGPNYRQLSASQQNAYGIIKRHYMNYDYCTDKNRYPVAPPECSTE
ncbi:hypothetical protein Droror1_Dr00011298 [Drosera rotundifolia]